MILTQACKWVHEVHIVDKYILDTDILKTYNADFVIHGDDIITDSSGESIYTKFQKLNAFRLCKRTTGISTTDIVNKILNKDNPNFF